MVYASAIAFVKMYLPLNVLSSNISLRRYQGWLCKQCFTNARATHTTHKTVVCKYTINLVEKVGRDSGQLCLTACRIAVF